jgi:hypothetical protein
VSLYYAVRDGIRYNPFLDFSKEETFRARSASSPARASASARRAARGLRARRRHPGAGRLRRRQEPPHHAALRERMGTDLFVYHGYTELLLEGKWVKATPAFNVELCRRFTVKPLEFDGREDSIFHPFDEEERRHMEYLRDRGSHADVPVAEIMQAFREAYPVLYGMGGTAARSKLRLTPRELSKRASAPRSRRPIRSRSFRAPAPAARRPHAGARRRQGRGLDGAGGGAQLAGGQEALRHRADPLRPRAAAGAHPLGRGRPSRAGRSGREGGARDDRCGARHQVGGPALALFSGGGSALLSLPVDGISIGDLRKVTQDLLRSGATIQEINTVRKHLSQIQGGRLAAACKAPVVTLIISDVTGDDATHIASGPCAPDPTTFQEAVDVLNRFDVKPPRAVLEHLIQRPARRARRNPQAGLEGLRPGREPDHRHRAPVAGGGRRRCSARTASSR